MQPVLNLADLLEVSTSTYASKTAVEDFFGNKITYQELNNSSESIKNLLAIHHIGAGNRIGILVPKSINAITSIFAVLKSGAAYVPLDCTAPINRNYFICNECELQALFIDKALLEVFLQKMPSHQSYTQLTINPDFFLLLFKKKKQVHTEPLSYIIYTSGSTGVPKGVKHTHTSALAFIEWTIKTFSPNKTDKFFSYAPFHFDLSIFDIFTCIYVGATLFLSDEKTGSNPLLFAQYLSKQQISVLYATPSVLTYLAIYGKMHKHTYQDLKLILFAGEVFPINHLKVLKDKLPKTQFYNLYGPTETNVCTWFKIPDIIPQDKIDPYPIGQVCEYAHDKILKDTNGVGEEGELLIAGTSLMSGYWNDPEKTNTKVKIDKDGKKWYHTGDIVKLNNEGNLVYLSRKDRMVKRNGYRIELNEIELNLIANKSIVEVAVTAKSTNSQTNTVITAHIVWVKNYNFSTVELLDYCHSILPMYMVPDNFEFYNSLPKTSTHKIDYNQLNLY